MEINSNSSFNNSQFHGLGGADQIMPEWSASVYTAQLSSFQQLVASGKEIPSVISGAYMLVFQALSLAVPGYYDANKVEFSSKYENFVADVFAAGSGHNKQAAEEDSLKGLLKVFSGSLNFMANQSPPQHLTANLQEDVSNLLSIVPKLYEPLSSTKPSKSSISDLMLRLDTIKTYLS